MSYVQALQKYLQSVTRETWLITTLLCFSLFLFFGFGLVHLSEFETADEHYWLFERIPAYFDAWEEGKYRRTLINDKPGVSLALISGFGLIALPDPTSLAVHNGDEDYTAYAVDRIPRLLYAFRFPLILANTLLLLLMFFLAVRVFHDRWVALWGTALTALAPILIGISQIVNPDALLWSLGFSTLLSLILLFRNPTTPLIVLSGTLLGFSLLTKYTATFLFPFSALVFLITLRDQQLFDRERLISWIQVRIRSFLLTVLVSLLIISIALPAVWLRKGTLWNLLTSSSDAASFILIATIIFFFSFWIEARIFGSRFLLKSFSWISETSYQRFRTLALLLIPLISITLILLQWLSFPILVNIPFDVKNISDIDSLWRNPLFLEILALEFNPHIFSITLPVLLGLLAFFNWRTHRHLNRETLQSALILTGFILLFQIAQAVSDVVSTVRYGILLYPAFGFLAGVGVRIWCLRFPRFLSSMRGRLFVSLVLSCALGVTVWLHHPFSLTYTNSLLPAERIISDGWGFGGFEAAQFINATPHEKPLVVWSDYYGVCPFIQGICFTDYTFDTEKFPPDYYVLSRRGKIRFRPELRTDTPGTVDAHRYYTKKPLWSLALNGQSENTIKIVKADRTLEVAIITDIDHCPSREAVSENALEQFVSSSRTAEVDFIVSLGDNASHRLRNCSITGDADARYIAARLRSGGLSTHFVLGDHDIASSVDSYQSWLHTIGREKTFYSFDQDNFHVIILDTVLGGEPLRSACEDDADCSSLQERLKQFRSTPFLEYQGSYTDAQATSWEEKQLLQRRLRKIETEIDQTRSFGLRDRGQISEHELQWLTEDLSKTVHQRVLILSDHPLFPFTSNKKRYDITNGEKVREVLEKSGKQIVAISGEAHLWHEETRAGIQYYIVDEFRKGDGSWAVFSWDKNGFHLAKHVTNPIDQNSRDVASDE